MLTLLFWVLILGILAWAITRFPIAEPFRTIAIAILLIIGVIILFRVLGTMDGRSFNLGL